MVFLEMRNQRPADIPEIVALSKLCFTDAFQMTHWTEPELSAHIQLFRQGQLVVVVDDRIVGSSSCLIARDDEVMRSHTWKEITGGGRFPRHDPQGDWLYGASVMVHPDYRSIGLLGLLYRGRKVTARKLDLQGVAIGGRMPGYAEVADGMSAEEYVAQVRRGERADMVLTGQMSFGFEPRLVLHDYLNDPASRNKACLMLWQAGKKHGAKPLPDEDMEELEEDLAANLDGPGH